MGDGVWVKEYRLSPLLAGFGGLLTWGCSTSSGFMGKLAPSLAQGDCKQNFIPLADLIVKLQIGLWLNQWFSNFSMQKHDLKGVLKPRLLTFHPQSF